MSPRSWVVSAGAAAGFASPGFELAGTLDEGAGLESELAGITGPRLTLEASGLTLEASGSFEVSAGLAKTPGLEEEGAPPAALATSGSIAATPPSWFITFCAQDCDNTDWSKETALTISLTFSTSHRLAQLAMPMGPA